MLANSLSSLTATSHGNFVEKIVITSTTSQMQGTLIEMDSTFFYGPIRLNASWDRIR